MTPRDPSGALGPTVPRTPVYEQALAALRASIKDELRAALERLATPEETAPLSLQLRALDGMRQRL